jgi:hypothetical protein
LNASVLKTITVPNINAGGQPAQVTAAGDRPLRVLVRSFGAITFLAFDNGEFTVPVPATGPPGGAGVAAGASDVFVLAPGQALYAGAVAGGVTASFAISDSFPVKAA